VPGGRGRGRGDGEEPERRSGADGETVRFGLGVAIDVTERNERIRELRRFETIVERMHESAFVVDRELRLQYANPSSLYWSDADLDAIRGTNVMTLAERMIVEDGTGASVEEFERTLRAVLERSPPDAPFPFADDWPDPIRLQLDLPTGEPVVEYHVAPVTDGEGGVVGVVVIGRDVTEQARRERELERQAERLRQFVDVASHDVRTPLSTARGWLELGREAIAEGDDPTTAFDRVASALDRTQRILDDASDLALADAPVDELALETVDLAEIARTAWTDVAAPPDVATLAVETSARVRADRLRLRRLIENLLRNGVEHGSRVVEGTDDPTAPAGEADAPDADSTDAVHLTVGELPDGTGFYVADDGPGVPARDRERVLEHGYTTRTGGTGYGLTIVSGIADAHGWSIAVTESETGGARFEIRGVEVVRDDETGESEGAVGDDDGDDDETGVQ
jgi:signal transduction histidine kinase